MARITITIIIFTSVIGFGFLIGGKTNLPVYRDISYRMLVNGDTTAACLTCHGSVVASAEVHPPAEKSCERCHELTDVVHLDSVASGVTMTEAVPTLCYSCHDNKGELENVHHPVQEGNCFICHDAHSSENIYLLKADPVSNLCMECHELDIPEGNHLHQPVEQGQCTGCHNPHQSDYDNLVNNEGPLMCRSCHREFRQKLRAEHVHPPAKENCFNCHEPHSSTEAHLSNSKPLDMCMNCHQTFVDSVHQMPSVHGAINIEKACLNCHDPHSSDERHIVVAKEKEMCISCHDKTIETDSGSIANIGQMLSEGKMIHGAIEYIGCSVCHSPHGSSQHTLLIEKFPEGNYANAERDNFSLCFRCHNRKLFEDEVTETVTNFRNGDKNLHHAHINGEKGRSCTLCHNVHASPNDHLIAGEVAFGNWAMPINYKSTETGGSCLPGCHQQKEYSRTALGIKPEIPDNLKPESEEEENE